MGHQFHLVGLSWHEVMWQEVPEIPARMTPPNWGGSEELEENKKVSGWALENRKTQQKNYTRVWLNQGKYLRSVGLLFFWGGFFGSYSVHSLFFCVTLWAARPTPGPVPGPLGHWSTGPEKGYMDGAHTQKTHRKCPFIHLCTHFC